MTHKEEDGGGSKGVRGGGIRQHPPYHGSTLGKRPMGKSPKVRPRPLPGNGKREYLAKRGKNYGLEKKDSRPGGGGKTPGLKNYSARKRANDTAGDWRGRVKRALVAETRQTNLEREGRATADG